MELDQYVPYLIENELVARGALYQKTGQPWATLAVEDNRGITGQNPSNGTAHCR